MFEKRPKYLGNDVDLWLKNLTNGLNKWEMTYVFGNSLKCLRNGQNIWEMR